jgi:AAA15 family ATPase/GTPase
MISHFKVKNYKCLADVSLPLTPIHVLIGQNDTGKTSLFEAIEAAVRVGNQPALQMHPLSAFNSKDFGELINHRANAKNISLSFDYQPTKNTAEIVRHDFMFSVDNPQGNKRLKNSPPPYHIKLQVLRFRPKLMAIPSISTSIPQFEIDSEGFGLSTLLDQITGDNVEQFVNLQKSFLEYFPKYKRIMLVPAQAYNRQYEPDRNNDNYNPGVGKEVRLATSDGDIRLAQASDGVILMLGFLALSYSPKPPNIILIEEPENGIHPRRLIELAKLLKRFVQKDNNAPQIIMTTHSPYLLSEFQPEEVTLMRRQPDGSAKAFPLRDAPHIRERMGSEFYLGELWYNLDEEELLK